MLPDVIKDNDAFKLNIGLDKVSPSMLSLFSDVNPKGFGKKFQITFSLNDGSPVSVKVS